MKIKNYQMYSNFVRVHFSNGNYKDIYYTANSGKPYFRYKIDTISDVRHTGIFIGKDYWGQAYYVDNHYKAGSPRLITENEFTLGKPMYQYNINCTNAWDVIISKALDHVLRQRSFNAVTYNCQSLTNDCCNNSLASEDAMKWVGRAAASVGIFLLLGAIFSNNE
jgi:hypothetical protein